MGKRTCGMTADVKSVDTVWFVKIVYEIKPTEDIVDEYGHKIIEGQIYLNPLSPQNGQTHSKN